MTLRTVLLSLQALLSAAEPDDPQDAVVARQYKEYPELFRQTAKHWTSIYAGEKFIHAAGMKLNCAIGVKPFCQLARHLFC